MLTAESHKGKYVKIYLRFAVSTFPSFLFLYSSFPKISPVLHQWQLRLAVLFSGYVPLMAHQYYVCAYVCEAVLCDWDWQAGTLAWTAANQTLWSFSQTRGAAKISHCRLGTKEESREKFISSGICDKFHQWMMNDAQCLYVCVWHYHCMTF